MKIMQDFKAEQYQKILNFLMPIVVTIGTAFVVNIHSSVDHINQRLSNIEMLQTVHTAKFDAIELALNRNDKTIERMMSRINQLELKNERIDEVLKNHSEKIDDKRRCIREPSAKTAEITMMGDCWLTRI